MTERTFRLSSPNLPAVPSPRVGDPTLQRTHDAVREVIETMRGTRGNTLDRAVFIRDLVATGILSLNAQSGIIGPGPSIDLGDDEEVDTSIPPALTNIVATAGFTYILLTWNDPQYKWLSHYEVYRLKVNDPNDSPGYTADDARITLTEIAQINALMLDTSRTPLEEQLLQVLSTLLIKTNDYDYAKNYHTLYPEDPELEEAYVAAGTALKNARSAVATTQSNSVGGAAHVGSTPSPVYSDPVDSGATYIYWVRAVSRSGVPGPFNAVGVSATTQPDISGVIDELTSEINRGVVTDLIFNGLDSPDNGLSLLENLLDLKDIAEQAQQDASDALSITVSGIPPSIWDAINALYNRMASSVLNTVVEEYKLAADVATLQDRVATAETTILKAQTDAGALAGRIDQYSTQYDTQFAQIGTALTAMSDEDTAIATQLTVLESAVYDPVTGLQASHGRIDDILDLTLTSDSAFLTTLTRLDAELDNTQGSIADILALQIRPDSALASRLTDLSLSLSGLSGQVQDLLSLTITPDSALAQKLTNLELEFGATNARVQDVLELNIDQDSILARTLRQLEGSVASASGAISDLSQLMVESDRVAALRVTKLEGEVDSAKGSVQDILELRISADTALGTKLTAIEATAGDASGKVSDILSLKIDPGSVLAGKLTELEAQTDFASGAVSDMLSLRFTSDDIKNSAYANAMQSFQLELDNLQSTVESYTYNVLNDFTDEYGNLTDPVARAGWGVRVEQSVSGVPFVSGFGLNQDIYLDSQGVPKAFSEFVVAADRFAVVDPSNPDVTKNSPFIVGPDPDDPSGPSRVWIRDAMISRAAIQSLTAGMVVADMVRVGAYITTPILNTPQINMGTWELLPGGDAMDPRDWVYNPASGRQGNFSVDDQGIMYATSAVLRTALIEDENGNVILDAGNGEYSTAIANDSMYLSVINGKVQLNGTNNPSNSLVTIDSLGARPLAGANVNNWDATDTAAAATLPPSNVHFFHIRLDKTNLQVTVTLRGLATSGTGRVRFHLEVVGAAVSSTGQVTTTLEAGEIPSWSAANIDFNTVTANVIAPNGLAITSGNGWLVGAGSNTDQLRFGISKLDDTVEFRLSVIEFSQSASTIDRAMVVLGDSTAIAQFRNPPLEFWFSPRDGGDYDALLLKNGPADPGATNGAPAGSYVDSVLAEDVATAIEDFNASNNRNGDAITAPTLNTTGLAVDHTLNTDGSADISFEWNWSGVEGDIDGFLVYVRQAGVSGAYTFGTTVSEETIYPVPANKRAFILFGTAANKYYHFAVRAYRKVDADVATGGVIYSPLVRTTATDEINGFLPSSSVAFGGNITGTVNNIPANEVNVWEKISGTGKPADNATVGANWNTNVTNIPYETIIKGDDATALGFNPVFAAWPDPLLPPTGWTWVAGPGTFTRETSVVRIAPYALRMSAAGGDTYMIRTAAVRAPAGSMVAGTVDIRYGTSGAARPCLIATLTYSDGSSSNSGLATPPAHYAGAWHRVPWSVIPPDTKKNLQIDSITIQLCASAASAGLSYSGSAFFDSLAFAFFDYTGVSTKNPITATNIGTYIASLAVGTLHIGANAVVIPIINQGNDQSVVQSIGTIGFNSVTTLSNAATTFDFGQIVGSGQRVVIHFTAGVWTDNDKPEAFQVRLYQDGALIPGSSRQGYAQGNTYLFQQTWTFVWSIDPAIGQHQYDIVVLKYEKNTRFITFTKPTMVISGFKR